MFGYVRPNIPELRVRDKARYDSIYCGLCHRLGKDYGIAARACLSYDCTFLALILFSVSENETKAEPRHCPFKPLSRKKPMVVEASPAMDFAAAVCVLLAKYKLDDDAADGKRLYKAAELPLHSAIKKAARRYPAVDAIISSNLRKLASIEAEKIPNPDIPANAFGQLLSELIGKAPVDEKAKTVLAEIGFNVGRFIYLADAWDDRATDAKHGLYNPFVLSESKESDAEFLMNISINNAIDALDLLEIRHDGELVYNIITDGLFGAMDMIKSKHTPKRKEKMHGSV